MKGLREFDDSIGRCIYCGKLIFKSDNDWVTCVPINEEQIRIAHFKCDAEYMRRTSQIGASKIV